MSNSYAIAAVTATLHNLLQGGLKIDNFKDITNAEIKPTGDVKVTILTLDRANKDNDNNNRINLFLYQTAVNATWRNMDMPNVVNPGETGQPPLALNLYYLITAYGEAGKETVSHLLLGQSMRILHDHPIMRRSDIESALKESQLHNQVELIRITYQPLSVEAMSQLWTTFQANYRISAAYQVDVVLIDSTATVKAPLPVLTLRPVDEDKKILSDKGILSQPNLIPPFPELTDLVLIKEVNGLRVELRKKYSAELGDKVSLRGHNLFNGTVKGVRFSNRFIDPIQMSPDSATVSEIVVKISDEPDKWVAGFYVAEVVISRTGEPDLITNGLPIAIAPKIETNFPIEVNLRVKTEITLDCSPQILPEQSAVLFLGDSPIQAQPHPEIAHQLKFVLKSVKPGEYFARLRIDGVDSLLVKDYLAEPLQFDPQKKVNIKNE